jgi:hypothetical protein
VDHRSSGTPGSTKDVPDHTVGTQPPRRATANHPAEDLLLYISCTTHVVSTALVVKRTKEGHAYPVQHLVYFISEVLGPSKIRYPQVQKLLYVVLLTARKLWHYFDEHKVIVVTGCPIGYILHNKEAVGGMAKWACELGAHDIEFRPRTAIKTQALSDFISKWTEHQVLENPEAAEVWKMYFDGSLRLRGQERQSFSLPLVVINSNMRLISCSQPPTMTRSMKP